VTKFFQAIFHMKCCVDPSWQREVRRCCDLHFSSKPSFF